MLFKNFLYGICDFSEIEDKLIECRAKERIPKNAKSVITILFPYYLGKDNYENLCISKYAVPQDYHTIVNNYLSTFIKELKEKYPDDSFEGFVDNSPIPEVFSAAISSLGVIGKNSLLINETYGSYVFIGEIVSTHSFKNTQTKIKSCISCDKCKKACPNSAIEENGINIEKCLSNISQKKGTVDEEYINMMVKNKCVWGCDICQDVCPMNKNVAKTNIEEFKEKLIFSPTVPTEILNRAYAFRGKKTIERNLNWLQKN
ncbi:MAG: DUF1730 domain-containing protein [Oscillospiraceae bacterium]